MIRAGTVRRSLLAPMLLALVAMFMGTSRAQAQTEPVAPHSSCESEPERTSTEGLVEADLTVINLTDSTFTLYWLDYDGERVFYQESPPHSSVAQPTWLTHPWILTDDEGTCYLLIVMNAQQQTMTIGTTTGEEPVTVVESTVARPTTIPPAATAPEASPTTVAVASTTPATEEEPGALTPLVVGALALMGVTVGVLLATGRITLPRIGRTNR